MIMQHLSRLIIGDVILLSRSNNHRVLHFFHSISEEVHGDVTAGVKRAWNVITAEKYSFFLVLEAFYFQFSLTSAQALVLWML